MHMYVPLYQVILHVYMYVTLYQAILHVHGCYATVSLVYYNTHMATPQLLDTILFQLCAILLISLILIASPVFYAQISWPKLEGYMTKSRKRIIKWHCLYTYTKEGLAAMCVFSILKLVNVLPESRGWYCLLAMAAGQMAGFALLLPTFLISTR